MTRNYFRIVAWFSVIIFVLGGVVSLVIAHKISGSEDTSIHFTQVIRADNVISGLTDITEIKSTAVTPTDYTVETVPEFTTDSVVDTPRTGYVVRFTGTVAQPKATIIIEIASDQIIRGSTMSDAFGAWSWTNYGFPLEEGNHTIRVSVLDTDAAAVRSSQYTFFVDATKLATIPTDLDLDTLTPTPSANADESFSISATYPEMVFTTRFVDQPIRYQGGSQVTVELAAEPLVAAPPEDAVLRYSFYREGEFVNAAPDFSYEQPLTITGDDTLSQSMQLSRNISPADYILSTQLDYGGVVYLSNQRMIVTTPTPTLAYVGGSMVNINDLGSAFWRNVVLFLFVAIIILAVAANEYRRFFVRQPISEDELSRQGYLTKQSNPKR